MFHNIATPWKQHIVNATQNSMKEYNILCEIMQQITNQYEIMRQPTNQTTSYTLIRRTANINECRRTVHMFKYTLQNVAHVVFLLTTVPKLEHKSSVVRSYASTRTKTKGLPIGLICAQIAVEAQELFAATCCLLLVRCVPTPSL